MPEQRAEDWLQGGDKAPLPISLDPARRGVWEKHLEDAAASTGPSAPAADKAGSSTSQEKLPAGPPPKAADPSSSSSTRPVSPPSTNSAAPQPQPTSANSQATAAPEKNGVQAAKREVTGSRPSLQDGETYISTDYKGRLMGDHIAKQLETHRSAGKNGPLMVGLQGPQGCGACNDGIAGHLADEQARRLCATRSSRICSSRHGISRSLSCRWMVSGSPLTPEICS